MDLPSRLLTLVEDLVELPRFLEVKRALDEAARGGMKTMGRVCREQAERIPADLDTRQDGDTGGGEDECARVAS